MSVVDVRECPVDGCETYVSESHRIEHVKKHGYVALLRTLVSEKLGR